jgi:quercetin dioxygenase-like cupin family protein
LEQKGMHFDGKFRFIGSVDPEPLARTVESFGEDAWLEFSNRQENYNPHRKTNTIPLLYDEDARHSNPTAWPRFKAIEPLLQPVFDHIRTANSVVGDDGYFVRIILTRLAPHAWINRHRDAGHSLKRSHRNHLAIITEESVEFEVGEEVRHLAPGEIWEINNRAGHAVRNNSPRPRIHMILDYVVPGERIEDPDGVVFG